MNFNYMNYNYVNNMFFERNEYTKILLQNILNNSTINHKLEIMKQLTIKDAHIYCKINKLSGQVYGPLLENYIKCRYNMIKNNASLCLGDLHYRDTNLEIKVSIGGKDNNKFNYVQLRMNHNCEYIFTAYYLDNSNINIFGELFIFKLSKNDIKSLILKYGGYAHGTITKLGEITQEDLDNIYNDKEYALRPKYNDSCWKSLLQYRIDEFTL